MKPIGKAVQVGIVSRKAFLLVVRLYSVGSRDNCSDQKSFVNVYTTANRINNFQKISLLGFRYEEKTVTESSHNLTGVKNNS